MDDERANPGCAHPNAVRHPAGPETGLDGADALQQPGRVWEPMPAGLWRFFNYFYFDSIIKNVKNIKNYKINLTGKLIFFTQIFYFLINYKK